MKDRDPVTNSNFQTAIDRGSNLLDRNDLDFFRRVWSTDLNIYRSRLKALQFVDLENVLDAGSGMGQWSLCLAELNRHVCAIDYSAARVEVTRAIMQQLGIGNIEVTQQSVEAIQYPSGTFDGIFCYSVIQITDYKKTLLEFHRVLKPGGQLYMCSHGLGWYLYNLAKAHQKSQHHNPRKMALSVMANTLRYELSGKRSPGKEIILSSRRLKEGAESIGFDRTIVGGEGTIRLANNFNPTSFFDPQYYGLEGVYEIVAWRKRRV